MWVRGHSSTPKMAPFDSLFTTSYQSAIVSIALSCTFFEIFDVERYRDLEMKVTGHSPNLCTICTSLKSRPGAVFCH